MQNQTNRGFGWQSPPCIDHVKIYFMQKGLTETEGIFFFNYYEQRNWKDQNNQEIKNWKTLACEWAWELRQFRRSVITK